MRVIKRRAQAIMIHEGRYIRVTYRRAKKRDIFAWKMLAAKVLSGQADLEASPHEGLVAKLEEGIDQRIAELCAAHVIELEDGGEIDPDDRAHVRDDVAWEQIRFEVEGVAEPVGWSSLTEEDRDDIVAYNLRLFVYLQAPIFQSQEATLLKKS